MTDYQRIILVHYHEIGLKGHNRASFETRLQKNLEALLAGYPVVTIHRISGRICVFLREGTGWDTAVEASELARGVPGVARVSSGFKCERDLDVMVDAAERAMREAGVRQLQSRRAPQPHRLRRGIDGHEPDHRREAVRGVPRGRSPHERP